MKALSWCMWTVTFPCFDLEELFSFVCFVGVRLVFLFVSSVVEKLKICWEKSLE